MGTGFAEPFGAVVVDHFTKKIERDLQTYNTPEKLAREIVKSGKMKKRILPLFMALNLAASNHTSIIRPRDIRNNANRVLKPSWFETDLRIKEDTQFDHPIHFNYEDITRLIGDLSNSESIDRKMGKETLAEAERKAGVRKVGRKVEADVAKEQDKGGPRVHYNLTRETMLARQILADPDVITLVYNSLKHQGLLFKFFSLIFDAMTIVITRLDFENIESLHRRLSESQGRELEWRKIKKFFDTLKENELGILKTKVVNLMVEYPSCLNFALYF